MQKKEGKKGNRACKSTHPLLGRQLTCTSNTRVDAETHGKGKNQKDDTKQCKKQPDQLRPSGAFFGVKFFSALTLSRRAAEERQSVRFWTYETEHAQARRSLDPKPSGVGAEEKGRGKVGLGGSTLFFLAPF